MRKVNKFRGWSPDLKGWVYGAYYEHCSCAVCFAEDDRPEYHEAKIIFETVMDWGFPYRTLVADVIKESVGRCVGQLPDGKEIYEGDIVQRKDVPGDVGIVKYGQHYSPLILLCSLPYIHWIEGDGTEQDIVCWLEDIRIIGNTFETPELIEKFTKEIEHGKTKK